MWGSSQGKFTNFKIIQINSRRLEIIEIQPVNKYIKLYILTRDTYIDI